MSVLYKTVKELGDPLQEYELNVFTLRKKLFERRPVPLLVAYCRDIYEGMTMSAMWDGVEVKQPYLRCTVSREHIINGQMTAKRSLKKIKTVRKTAL